MPFPPPVTSNQFIVDVGENLYYPYSYPYEKSDIHRHGSYATYAEAEAACKAIVDDFLKSEQKPGMTAEALYDQYTRFGDDPWIWNSERPIGDSFSALTYAKQRCQEICPVPSPPPQSTMTTQGPTVSESRAHWDQLSDAEKELVRAIECQDRGDEMRTSKEKSTFWRDYGFFFKFAALIVAGVVGLESGITALRVLGTLIVYPSATYFALLGYGWILCRIFEKFGGDSNDGGFGIVVITSFFFLLALLAAGSDYHHYHYHYYHH